MLDGTLVRNNVIAASDFTWVFMVAIIVSVTLHRALYVNRHRDYEGWRMALVFLLGVAISETGFAASRIYWFLVNKAWAYGWIETGFGQWLLAHAPAFSNIGLAMHALGVTIALSTVFKPAAGRIYWPVAALVVAGAWLFGLLI